MLLLLFFSLLLTSPHVPVVTWPTVNPSVIKFFLLSTSLEFLLWRPFCCYQPLFYWCFLRFLLPCYCWCPMLFQLSIVFLSGLLLGCSYRCYFVSAMSRVPVIAAFPTTGTTVFFCCSCCSWPPAVVGFPAVADAPAVAGGPVIVLY